MKIIKLLFSLLINIFYRKVDVIGLTNIPTGPAIFVAMHPNGLIDGLLILLSCKRQLSVIVKHTLFNLPIIGFLLRSIKAIPVQRRSDTESNDNRNSFYQVVKRLSEQGSILIFPEGVSHNYPTVQPLKSGFLRMIQQTLKETDVPEVNIIPVGLNYLEKDRFRSDVLIVYDKPIKITKQQLEVDNFIPYYLTLTSDRINNITNADPQRLLVTSILSPEEPIFHYLSKLNTNDQQKQLLSRYSDILKQYNLTDYQVYHASKGMKRNLLANFLYLLLTNAILVTILLPVTYLTKKISDRLAKSFPDQIAHFRLMIGLLLSCLSMIIYLSIASYFYSLWISSCYLILMIFSLRVIIADQPISKTFLTLSLILKKERRQVLPELIKLRQLCRDNLIV